MTSYYRHVYQIEVLTDEPWPDITDLDTIHHQITDGQASGLVTTVTLNEPVTEDRMAELLTAQGSDPEFLIPDPARWRT